MQENWKKVLVTITWVSWSGKSTLQSQLVNSQGWKKPINFTTRKPRSDREKDEYVFLTEDQYFTKLKNWDFAEYIKYGDNYYAISKYLSDWVNCMVVDPVGRAVFQKYCAERDIPIFSILIEISEDLQEYRLGFLRRESVSEIEKRKRDFIYMKNTGDYDLVLDWSKPIEKLEDIILEELDKKSDEWGF